MIKTNYLVEKRNVLNEIRATSMTLQELRFFTIYLSKINARDINTRVVRFAISDFQAIMQLESRIKIDDVQRTTNSLLCKVVNVPDGLGGYTGFQLFKRCRVSQDENEEWYIEIDAHDDALPLMFEFKNNYFKYHLWNALRLRSSNQLRMYEILKQYEKVGFRVLELEELRELLGIDKKEYPRFNNFKQWVLDPCKESLQKNTDIKFTYEPHSKKGKKIQSLKFIISKNKVYDDPINLETFLHEQDLKDLGYNNDDEDEIVDNTNDMATFLGEACDDEFSREEIELLHGLIVKATPRSSRNQLDMYEYLNTKYKELTWRSTKVGIKNRFGYLKKLISLDIDEN